MDLVLGELAQGLPDAGQALRIAMRMFTAARRRRAQDEGTRRLAAR